MESMQTDPIQTQREIWLRSIVLCEQRAKEEAEGLKRLRAAVDAANERRVSEEQKLDDMIAEAKVKYDDYKKLPQSLAATTDAKAVEEGGAFAADESGDASPEPANEAGEAGRLVPRREVAIGASAP